MIRISIDGMSCQHCVHHVREALAGLEGVKVLAVSLEKGTAEVETEEKVKEERINAALAEEGYEVTAIVRE